MEQKRLSVNGLFFWITAMICISVCFGGCQKGEIQADLLSEKMPVIVKEVSQIFTDDVVFVSGVLEADKTVPLSFLVPGKVDHVYVDEGDHVKKGQILAKIEINDYWSNLEIAEAQLFETQDSYDRMWPLYKNGAIAEKAFIKIKAGLDQAKASRDIAKKKVRDTKLQSPIPGIVGAKNVELGQTISTGIPVFTIVKTDRIYARVSVPESEIGKVALGQKAAVTIKALDDRIVEGKVTMIGAMAEPRTRTYTVKIELPNPDYVLRTGMIAKTQIITYKTIAMITVPGKAIVRDADNLTYVFLVDKEKETALRQRVFPGSVFRNEIEIKEGLNIGDVVIIAGQHKITDGAPITVMDLTNNDGAAPATKQKS